MVAIASLVHARAVIEDPKWRLVAALHLGPGARASQHFQYASLDAELVGMAGVVCPPSLRLGLLRLLAAARARGDIEITRQRRRGAVRSRSWHRRGGRPVQRAAVALGMRSTRAAGFALLTPAIRDPIQRLLATGVALARRTGATRP